ncbi:DUF4186 family protein [Candidatus Nanohalococcus occultus]|uniref:DUF4186 family protein n=1 Tax=Candidatus Nanohalococcus occultus TaxID=2978047 RepID=A0ABY8CFS8_9ARCH|nr:DUF4186 family protein [Candidatus Nanohaloarchaeota archaeon SVXNc]
MRKLKLPGRDQTFRRLSEQDIRLIEKVGIPEIQNQARKIIEKKLMVQPENDGRQTPKAGHPVYKAMHACNVQSRKSLSLSHKIPAGKELEETYIESTTNLVMRWIVREYNFYQKEREDRQRNLSEFN